MRVITNFNAEAGMTSDKVILRLLEEIPAHREGDEITPNSPPH